MLWCLHLRKAQIIHKTKNNFLGLCILQMQQVIRSLQSKRLRELQRKKIKQLTPQQFFNNIRYYSKQSTQPHKVLQHQYQHLQNFSYNRLERISEHKIYPLSHVFAYQPLLSSEMREEQQRSRSISENNQFLRHYNPADYEKSKEENQMKIKEYQKLQIQKKIKAKIRSKARKKLRAAFLAVFFTIAIKTHFKDYLKAKKERTSNMGKMFAQQALVSFQDYYYSLLQQQITQYILLLEKASRYADYDPGRDIMRILTFMTNKLNNSPIPKSLLAALELTATNHCFYPFLFLFRQEAERLKFSKKWGCSVEVEKDESCMLGACFMGIGMLCYNLLYRPWLSEDLFRKKQKRQFKIKARYKQLKQLINGIGSVIYFLVLDNFVLNMPVVERKQTQFEEMLRSFQIRLAPKLKIVVQVEEQDFNSSDESGSEEESAEQQKKKSRQRQKSGKELSQDEEDEIKIIAHQDRRFFNQLNREYQSEMMLIQQNLKEWIIKAVLIAIKKAKSQAEQRKSGLLVKQLKK